MGDLSCFLAQNAVKAENVKHVVSRRFLDKAGRPMEWEIQSITSTEDEALRRECTKSCLLYTSSLALKNR